MAIQSAIAKLAQIDMLNFLVTNYIPRRLAGRWIGRISRSENGVVCALSLWIWRCFTDLDLADADRTQFRSMHDCFTRRLRPGARPIDPDPAVLTSPCDAIIGAFGTIAGGRVSQVKGMDYTLTDLLDDSHDAATLEGGSFVTLRLTSAMYHRYHAPYDIRVERVRHIFGDSWNVNPPTLRKVARLFCRNERVVIHSTLCATGQPLTLVAVAAILVSGIRLSFLRLETEGRPPIRRSYDCNATLAKGAEMGWFEHGSTIVLLAPRRSLVAGWLREGDRIRVGERLLRRSDPTAEPN